MATLAVLTAVVGACVAAPLEEPTFAERAYEIKMSALGGMHHKRRRPKRQRAGCLWCKPHKDEREGKRVPLEGLTAPRRLRRLDDTRSGAR